MTATTCSGTGFTVAPVNGINGTVPAGTTYSWSAPTGAGFTGGLSATNAGSISGTLVNTTNAPVTATYLVTPLSNGVTGAVFSVTVTINPQASITAISTTVCSGIVFSTTPTNITNGIIPTGTTYSWSAPTGTGFTGGQSGSSASNISGTLVNTTNSVVTASYQVTPQSGTCTGSAFTVTANINPVATITDMSTTVTTGIVFSVTPVNGTNGIVPSGTAYSWSAPIVTGGVTGGVTATGASISQTLVNPTNAVQTATYTVTPTSGTCTGSPFTVTVTVKPTAVITPMTATICSGSSFTVTPASGTVPSGTTYSWSAPTGTGFTGGQSGTNASNISGALINTTNSAVTATYLVTPLSNGVTGTPFSVTVTINPQASITALNTSTCSGAGFNVTPLNSTNGIVPTGTLYSWSAPNVTGGLTGGSASVNAVNINGILSNTLSTTQTATYFVTPVSGNCTGTAFTVTVSVNPIPTLSSTLSPTAVFGGALLSYTPTSATNGTIFNWTRPAVSNITNPASSGTGSVNENLINNGAAPVNVNYNYTLTAAGCTNSQTVTISVIPSGIKAVNDDYTSLVINGAKGATTPSVLSNDTLNNILVDPSLINLTLVSNGGITGLTFDSTGALIIPSNTFEGTYTITYQICVKANPGSCSQATVLVKIARGLLLTATPICRNDVPYVHYKVVPNFIPSTTNPVTLTWLNGDKTVVTAQPVANGIALENDLLWPGATVDSLGNPTDWPGWILSNGLWIQGSDGFENTRPNAYLVISVNPIDTILVSYPPATPACNAIPYNRAPVAINDFDSTGQCSTRNINVLANDSDFEHGALTVSLPSARSANNGNISVNPDGTVAYTPATGFTGTDTFNYTITDPAGLTATATVTVKINAKPSIIGGIIGTCAIPKDSAKIFSVLPVPNATGYLWSLPTGWTGSSTTDSISIKPGNTNGTIKVVPYNGTCFGDTVSYQVSVIDFAKVTIGASPSTVLGDNNSTSQITIQLYDVNGNLIHCSGGTATLCTNSGTFTSVVDNGDGTYTSYLKSSANNAIICGSVGGVMIQQTVTTTFTGPQGSISGNGPIFATETPLLTFNFTAGVGPFTVIYKAGNNTKNDTLTNVTSNTPVPVKSISATTLYRMVSIIGTDNARRDNNFTRDTATIIVVEPKIVVTLTSTNPKFLADNLYSTVLNIKVKNIGDINLNSVQVKASLKDVFPNPVQFILDSVQQFGVKTVPNNGYDGIQSLDLFSWNSRPGKRTIPDYTASVVSSEKYGINTESDISENSVLNSTDGELTTTGKQPVEVPFLPGFRSDKVTMTAGETPAEGPVTTPFFFGTLSKLDAGVETDMYLYVRIVPNGYYKPFIMQVVAVGTGNTQYGTALANSLSNDNGNTNLHPEITGQGEPLPTVITVFPNPVLGVALNAGTPIVQADGSYNVSLTYVLQNYGNVNLRSINLYDNLLKSIGSPANFQVVGIPVASDNLFANPGFDGKIDTNLLAPNSMLGVGLQSTVQFTINIKPNQLAALYRLQATGTGFCNELSTTVTDLSTNGSNPDPDGNLIPDEKLITIIAINSPIPPLVPGGIGIQNLPSAGTVALKGFCASGTVVVIPNSLNTGGTDPYTYQWQSSTDSINFTNIPGATDSTYTSAAISTNLYLRRVVISGNQQAFSNSVHIQIFTVTKPVITVTGSPYLTQGGSITLSSSAATAYLWSNKAVSQTIAVTTGGAYSVTTTDANGCIATADPVGIYPPPPTTVNATYIIGASTNPANSGVQVTGLPGATLNYYILSSGGTLIPVPSLPDLVGTYTYYVSQTVNGYESVRVPYTVTMLNPVKISDVQKVLSKAPELQADGTFLLTFTIISSNLRSELLDSVKIKDDLTKVFPSAVKFQVLNISASGKLIANELYDGISQIELLSDGSQLAGLQKDSIVLVLKVTPNGFTGPLNNTAIQVAKSPLGTFTVNSNDPLEGDGLTARIPTKFTIPTIDIFIPSGFSPNRDGVNDYFVITRPFNTSINLEIFNRWGNLVYKSADYKNDWDGRGNQPNNILGEPLPDGTYYYIVTATDKTTGNTRKFASFITLKR